MDYMEVFAGSGSIEEKVKNQKEVRNRTIQFVRLKQSALLFVKVSKND